MAYICILIYLTILLTQVTVWVPLFMGKPLAEIFILLSFLFSLFQNSGDRIAKIFKSPQTYCFLFFIIWSIIGLRPEGMQHAIGIVGYKLFKYFITSLAIVLALDSIGKIKGAIYLLIFLGIFLAVNSFEQYYTGTSITGQTLNWRGGVRWVGFFDGSNGFCLLFNILIAYTLSIVIQKGTGGVLLKLFALFTSCLFLSVIFLTGSRGGFLALVCVFLSQIYFRYREKIKLKTFIPLALILGLTIIVLKPSEEGRGYGESSSSERVELFYQGLQMIKTAPLLGVGSGEFWRNNPVQKEAHNLWLQHMAETGLVGGTLIVFMFYITFKNLSLCLENFKKDATTYATIVQVVSGIIGFLACAFFLTVTFEMPYVMVAFGWSVPFALSQSESTISKKDVMIVSIANMVMLGTIYFAVRLFFAIFK